MLMSNLRSLSPHRAEVEKVYEYVLVTPFIGLNGVCMYTYVCICVFYIVIPPFPLPQKGVGFFFLISKNLNVVNMNWFLYFNFT